MRASLIVAQESARESARDSARRCDVSNVRAATRLPPTGTGVESRDRHATCMPSVFLEKDSHSCHESVNFSHRGAKVVRGDHRGPTAGAQRCPAAWLSAGRQDGWNHGAARNGNRKRSRVRVACGGDIRPRGLGHQPIHGHYGLSVVGRDSSPPVVCQPACEFRIRQRHLSRGPGLLAALTSRDTSLARKVRHERPSARHQPVEATRPVGIAMNSAAPVLTSQPERPAAGRGAHNPSPRTRLRLG